MIEVMCLSKNWYWILIIFQFLNTCVIIFTILYFTSIAKLLREKEK